MEIVKELGGSLLNDILVTASSTIISYFKDKKNDEKYQKIIKQLEENKKAFEKELLSYTENKISTSSFISDNILSKYNLDLLLSTTKSIFGKQKMDSIIKIKIEENIKNYKFVENLHHFNILVLGRAGIGKSTLVNSILELDGTPEAAKTGIGKAITQGEPTGYVSNTKKGLRLWDSQGIDKEKYHISKAVESVKKLINEASINNDPDKFIHCIWYCVTGERFEESERESLIELMKIYDDDTLPIIIVYTEAYNEEDADAVSDEIRNVLREKINKNKEVNICQVVAKNKEIKMGQKNFVIEKTGIKALMDISLKKIILAVNSACFYSFKNKLKKDNEEEINKIGSDLKNMIENRTNNFETGNKISNISQLNNQIVNNIIKKLFGTKEIVKEVKSEILSLLKKYQEFILNECYNSLPDFLGKCSAELIMNYKNEKDEEDNVDELNIKNQISLNMMNHILNNQKKQEKSKKNDRNGFQDDLMVQLQTIFQDYVIKKASFFIDNKIKEEISKLIIESYNQQINDFNDIIQNIVKESMNSQSLNIMNNFKFE